MGLKVAPMGDLGASIAKNGPALKALSKGQDVVEAAPISNATRRVANESGSSSGYRVSDSRRHLNEVADFVSVNNLSFSEG